MYYRYMISPPTSFQTLSHFLQPLVYTLPSYIWYCDYFIQLFESFPPPDSTNPSIMSQLLHTMSYGCIVFFTLVTKQIKLNTPPLYLPCPSSNFSLAKWNPSLTQSLPCSSSVSPLHPTHYTSCHKH